ncbi:MAG: sensor domain-containing diguanylate cyclase, partial [Clostridiales bacterium]|nr:sensor domain-containing diguanylate cyclase [Clostridiales bacterium]
MAEDRDILLMQKYLDTLLAGKVPAALEAVPSSAAAAAGLGGAAVAEPAYFDVSASGEDDLLNLCFEKFGKLLFQLNEIRNFMQALARGELETTVPGRRNYLAAPLKELHTQFSSLTWSMEQLAKGNIVSRLYYPGVLFESFNSLIEKVASVSNQLESAKSETDSQWEWSVNSWRYHQILSALNNLRIMVLEVAEDGKIVYANRPAREYFGEIPSLRRSADGGALSVSVLERYLAKVGAKPADGMGGCEGGGGADEFPRFREIFDEPNNCWYKITSDRVQFSDTKTGYLHMVDNISEWKKHESNLKLTATTDPLTGIYNRGFGLQALEEAVFAAKGGVPSCAAFVDLDGLKAINDLHGHNSGDYAIKTIAQVLASSVRDKDIVCRFGGDEFIIIFKNCTEPLARRAIDRMHQKLAEINREGPME